MEHVKAFGNELHSLHELKPPISRAKMSQITKTAMRAIKFYKHIVQAVEKFIHKCRPEYKVPGLYVIDSIVRQSRHQYGSDKDVFVPRFTKNFCSTFQQLFKCPDEDKSKIVRVLNLWQKNGVLPIDIIQPLLDLAKDPMNPAVFENAQKDIEAAAAKLGSAKKSSTDVSGDTDGEGPRAEPGSRHTDLIESITELLMQQSQQPVSPAAAVAAQQLQQQLHHLQRQLLQATASGGSADAAAAALSNLETLAEQLLQQHQASLTTNAGSAKPMPASGDGLAPPPPPPAVGNARSQVAENGVFGTKQAAVATFNSKLLDYDYDDSDEDLDRGSDSHEQHLEDSNDREPVKAPAASSALTTAVSLADSHSSKQQELPMTNSLASQHMHLPGLRPPLLYQEHLASSTMPPQPFYGYPDFQHHQAVLASTYNGQAISSLLPPASLALGAGTVGMQLHGMQQHGGGAAATVMADGRLVIGGTVLHSSEIPNQLSMQHLPPPVAHIAPPVPNAAPPLPHAPPPMPHSLPPMPHALPPMPPSQPPLPPPSQNDSVAEEDVDYRTDMDYRVLRDRDERDRTRDDRERSNRDGRRRSRSPRRYRSPERDSRHRRSRSRERRNRSRSREREREELERKRREKDRERRHQGLPPLKDKCAIVCSTTLWIGRLNKQTTESDIRRELEQHGPILTINLIPPRGCAYVCMTTRSDATRALDKLLKGVRLLNNTLKAAWAPPKAIGDNVEFKSFWDLDRGCAYIPYDRLPSDLSALNGEGVFVDEESLPEHLKQPPPQSASPPPPAKEEQQHEKGVADAVGASTTSATVTDIPRSPSHVAAPAQHMPFMPGGMSLPAPHVISSLAHQVPHSPSYVMSGLVGQGPSMASLMVPHSRGSQLLLPHGVGPAGVPPPPLGFHHPLSGLIPGGIGGSFSGAGGLFSASSLQRHPLAMPLSLMSVPPLPGGVPPPLPPSSLPPHTVPPLPPTLQSHVTQIAASQASASTLPAGPKEAGHHDENPQLAQAIENIVSNAASIQAVVQALAVSAVSSSAPSSTGSAAPSLSAPAVISSQQSSGGGSLQSEALSTGSQASVPLQSLARSGTTSDDKASWDKKPLDSKDPASGEPDDSHMEESVDEDEDEDDGGANSMGGPSALHQHHRQQYQYRGQGHRPYLPRPPAGPPGHNFQPDGRRMLPFPRGIPPPGFQGPPPPTHLRPPPQLGFRPLLHEPPFNPMMLPPGMAPPPLGHRGPPPPIGPPPHGPPPFGLPPHGMPPHGLPPHGPPPPNFDAPRFDIPPFDGSGPLLGNLEDLDGPAGSKPVRRSRWQDGMRDDEGAAPPGATFPMPSQGEDATAVPPP